MTPLEAATALLAQGVACIPCHHFDDERSPKTPKIPKWKEFQDRLPLPTELAVWFKGTPSLAILGGVVTCLDLDTKNAPAGFLEDWMARAESAGLAPLLERLIQQETPSGGRHYVFRCPQEVRNLKLAEDAEHQTLIETRGQGGYFLAFPSKGYTLTRGDFAEIPEVTVEERDELFTFARSFGYVAPPEERHEPKARAAGEVAPGEDFNARGDVPALLTSYGWQQIRGSCYWTRPGKKRGVSASWNRDGNGHFVCFTSNAHPFDPSTSYTAFAVLALIAHGGDYAEAASALRRNGFGSARPQKPWEKFAPASFDPPSQQSPDEDSHELPMILAWDEEEGKDWEPAPFLVEGLVRQGDIGSFNGPSKTRKSWTIIDFGLSVAGGLPFLGFPTRQAPVMILNMELRPETFRRRRQAIQKAKQAVYSKVPLFTWHLRGHRISLLEILRLIRAAIKEEQIKLILIDPVYKLAGQGNESDPEAVAQFFCELETMARETGAAVIFCHHFSKGNQHEKKAQERGSGSGVWVRAPDALIMMTPPPVKDDDGTTVTIEASLRDCPPVAPFTLRWEHPLWVRGDDVTQAEKHTTEKRAKRDVTPGAPAKLTAEQLRIVLKGVPGGRVTAKNVNDIATACRVSASTIWGHWTQIKDTVQPDDNSLASLN